MCARERDNMENGKIESSGWIGKYETHQKLGSRIHEDEEEENSKKVFSLPCRELHEQPSLVSGDLEAREPPSLPRSLFLSSLSLTFKSVCVEREKKKKKAGENRDRLKSVAGEFKAEEIVTCRFVGPSTRQL